MKVKIARHVPDKSVWEDSLHRDITCCNMYSILVVLQQALSWAKLLQFNSIPLLQAMLCWRLFHGKILVDESFCHKGFSIGSRCHLYKKDVETVTHLFLHYPFAKAMWDLLG